MLKQGLVPCWDKARMVQCWSRVVAMMGQGCYSVRSGLLH